jgi:hypothetical protein
MRIVSSVLLLALVALAVPGIARGAWVERWNKEVYDAAKYAK